jgi:hypothetical protein
MAFPLEPSLEYGLHSSDQTTIDLYRNARLESCDAKNRQISPMRFALLFPLSAIACLIQFRVAPRHYFCLKIVQIIAYTSQYPIENTWNQPQFVANLLVCHVSNNLGKCWYWGSHESLLAKSYIALLLGGNNYFGTMEESKSQKVCFVLEK